MKKQFCLFICMLLTLGACALAEGGQLPLAAALEAYLPTADWGDYVASDLDGDGYNDTYMLIFEGSDGSSINISCQCFDGLARVVGDLAEIPADADPLKVYGQVNEFNRKVTFCRWWYDEGNGLVRCTQEIYGVVGDDFGAYALNYMRKAASYVYSFEDIFMEAIL